MSGNAFPRSASFVVPGNPVGKARPRFVRGRTYTPQKTVEYEQIVAASAHDAMPEPFTGPIRIEVYAWFEIPPSLSAKKRSERLATRHMQKPDLDNIVKTIKDGLNGIAYADDAQVSEIAAVKFWGTTGKCEVVVRELVA